MLVELPAALPDASVHVRAIVKPLRLSSPSPEIAQRCDGSMRSTADTVSVTSARSRDSRVVAAVIAVIAGGTTSLADTKYVPDKSLSDGVVVDRS